MSSEGREVRRPEPGGARRRTNARWAVAAAGAVLALVLFALRPGGLPIPPAFGPRSGMRLLCRVDYRTSSETDFRVLFEGGAPAGKGDAATPFTQARTYRTVLQGEFLMDLLEDGADRIVRISWPDPPSVTLEVGGRSASEQASAVARALNDDILIRTDPRGRVLGVLMETDAGGLAGGFVMSLVAKIQFVLPDPSRSGVRSWKAEEEDPNGRYLARYETVRAAMSKRGLRAVRKTKEMYFPPDLSARSLLPRRPAVVSPRGSLEYLINTTDGYVEAIDGGETETIAVSGREVARVESRIAFRMKEEVPGDASEHAAATSRLAARRAAAAFVPLSRAGSEEASEAAVQRAALGEETLESLTAELEEAEAEGRRETTALYLKVKALVYLRPEVCAVLAEILVGAPAGGPTRDIVAGALGAVGHPEAQDALAEVMRSRRDDPAFVRGLVQALARAPSPTESSEMALRALAADHGDGSVHAAALFGLGSMSRRLKDTDSERSGRIAAWLVSLIGPGPPESEAALVLKALGNSGADAALPILREYAKTGPASLRATAAAGLRFVDSGEADRLLAEVLGSDPDETVRAAALLALGFRKPTRGTVKAQVRAAREDGAEAVRMAALKNLGDMSARTPEVLRAIRRAAREDPSEGVRKAAADLLSILEKKAG